MDTGHAIVPSPVGAKRHRSRNRDELTMESGGFQTPGLRSAYGTPAGESVPRGQSQTPESETSPPLRDAVAGLAAEAMKNRGRSDALGAQVLRVHNDTRSLAGELGEEVLRTQAVTEKSVFELAGLVDALQSSQNEMRSVMAQQSQAMASQSQALNMILSKMESNSTDNARVISDTTFNNGTGNQNVHGEGGSPLSPGNNIISNPQRPVPKTERLSDSTSSGVRLGFEHTIEFSSTGPERLIGALGGRTYGFSAKATVATEWTSLMSLLNQRRATKPETRWALIRGQLVGLAAAVYDSVELKRQEENLPFDTIFEIFQTEICAKHRLTLASLGSSIHLELTGMLPPTKYNSNYAAVLFVSTTAKTLVSKGEKRGSLRWSLGDSPSTSAEAEHFLRVIRGWLNQRALLWLSHHITDVSTVENFLDKLDSFGLQVLEAELASDSARIKAAREFEQWLSSDNKSLGDQPDGGEEQGYRAFGDQRGNFGGNKNGGGGDKKGGNGGGARSTVSKDGRTGFPGMDQKGSNLCGWCGTSHPKTRYNECSYGPHNDYGRTEAAKSKIEKYKLPLDEGKAFLRRKHFEGSKLPSGGGKNGKGGKDKAGKDAGKGKPGYRKADVGDVEKGYNVDDKGADKNDDNGFEGKVLGADGDAYKHFGYDEYMVLEGNDPVWKSREDTIYKTYECFRGGKGNYTYSPSDYPTSDSVENSLSEGLLFRRSDSSYTTIEAVDDSGATGLAVPYELHRSLEIYRQFDEPQVRGTASASSGVTIRGDGILIIRPKGLTRWLHVYAVVGDFSTVLSPTIYLCIKHDVEFIPTRGTVTDLRTGESATTSLNRFSNIIEFEVRPKDEQTAFRALPLSSGAETARLADHLRNAHYPPDPQNCGDCAAGLLKQDSRGKATVVNFVENEVPEGERVGYILALDSGGPYPKDPVDGSDTVGVGYDYGSATGLAVKSVGRTDIFYKLIKEWLSRPWPLRFVYPDNPAESKSQRFISLLRENSLGLLRSRDHRKSHGGAESLLGLLLAGSRTLCISADLPPSLGIRALLHRAWVRNRIPRKFSGTQEPVAPVTKIGEGVHELDLKRLSPFGAWVYGIPASGHVTTEQKLSGKGVFGYFTGLSKSRAYIVVVPQTEEWLEFHCNVIRIIKLKPDYGVQISGVGGERRQMAPTKTPAFEIEMDFGGAATGRKAQNSTLNTQNSSSTQNLASENPISLSTAHVPLHSSGLLPSVIPSSSSNSAPFPKFQSFDSTHSRLESSLTRHHLRQGRSNLPAGTYGCESGTLVVSGDGALFTSDGVLDQVDGGEFFLAEIGNPGIAPSSPCIDGVWIDPNPLNQSEEFRAIDQTKAAWRLEADLKAKFGQEGLDKAWNDQFTKHVTNGAFGDVPPEYDAYYKQCNAFVPLIRRVWREKQDEKGAHKITCRFVVMWHLVKQATERSHYYRMRATGSVPCIESIRLTGVAALLAGNHLRVRDETSAFIKVQFNYEREAAGENLPLGADLPFPLVYVETASGGRRKVMLKNCINGVRSGPGEHEDARDAKLGDSGMLRSHRESSVTLGPYPEYISKSSMHPAMASILGCTDSEYNSWELAAFKRSWIDTTTTSSSKNEVKHSENGEKGLVCGSGENGVGQLEKGVSVDLSSVGHNELRGDSVEYPWYPQSRMRCIMNSHVDDGLSKLGSFHGPIMQGWEKLAALHDGNSIKHVCPKGRTFFCVEFRGLEITYCFNPPFICHSQLLYLSKKFRVGGKVHKTPLDTNFDDIVAAAAAAVSAGSTGFTPKDVSEKMESCGDFQYVMLTGVHFLFTARRLASAPPYEAVRKQQQRCNAYIASHKFILDLTPGQLIDNKHPQLGCRGNVKTPRAAINTVYDASFGVTSHGASVTYYRGSLASATSYRIPSVCTGSPDAEAQAGVRALREHQFVSDLLLEWGECVVGEGVQAVGPGDALLPLGFETVSGDNTAAQALLSGGGVSRKSRAIALNLLFARERAAHKHSRFLSYRRTAEMEADLGTKVVNDELFRKFSRRMGVFDLGAIETSNLTQVVEVVASRFDEIREQRRLHFQELSQLNPDLDWTLPSSLRLYSLT